jgi:MSHA biogenesis protein MshL
MMSVPQAAPKTRIRTVSPARKAFLVGLLAFSCLLPGCADVDVPAARNVKIPSPAVAQDRPEAVNEQPDSVLYLPLGSDVLVPSAQKGDSLPDDIVGPFELRSETLAGALQLILADYEIPMAFETNEAMTRTITVANLRGPLRNVVEKVCGLADLYCAYEDGLLVVKDTQTFTVVVPPIGTSGGGATTSSAEGGGASASATNSSDILAALATGLQAITGTTPITETATRTIVYQATNRTARMAESYFQRIRSNTALIVFEVYIWEVSLNADNATGIDWENIAAFGKFKSGIKFPGPTPADNAISIGIPTTGDFSFGADQVLSFISNYGAVKTISQPQITVLSGAQATLRAADTVNYVSSLSRSTDNGETTISTETSSVDTGFTLSISSAWDNATVYGNINISLQQFQGFDTFGEGTENELQLPKTTERQLSTQIRIRPGDSLLIGGLVRENDEHDTSGPGFFKPLFPTSRSASSSNTELVFLLKPRVIVYTTEGDPAMVRPPLAVAPTASVSAEPQVFPVTSIPAAALNPSSAAQ